MDVMTQKDDLEYLPELTKLKHNLGVERYLDDCEQVASTSLAVTRIEIEEDSKKKLISIQFKNLNMGKQDVECNFQF